METSTKIPRGVSSNQKSVQQNFQNAHDRIQKISQNTQNQKITTHSQ